MSGGPACPERATLTKQLATLGVRPGGILLVHSSLRAIGVRDPEVVLGALLDALGPDGTLMLPALSYLQDPIEVHDTRTTPSCVGYLAEYFRTRPGTLRSLHPTHSVCAAGPRAEELLADHLEDETPCGPHSPFRRLIENGGQVAMLGCGLRPFTTMHAIEEYVAPPYLFGGRRLYTITDARGGVHRKEQAIHGFKGYGQRYDRMADLLAPPDLVEGPFGSGTAHVVDAGALCRAACERMREDPFAFVERIAAGN